jgi:hypothetical protein
VRGTSKIPGGPSEAILPRRIILFLGANPRDTRRLALRQECAAIKRELRLATHGGEFEFQYKWPVTVDKMAQLLISSKPTIIWMTTRACRNW